MIKFFREKQSLFLALIVFLAIFFRLYRLGAVPPSPSLDEVSLGWNAYSILKTGKDEYGHRLPLLFRAYDDWRPGLYVYLVIPFVKLFGLSAMVVRLSSFLLSLVTILGLFFLVKELFRGSKDKWNYSLSAMFLLAISPWHIYISRLGHEVNAGLTLSVLSCLLFLKAVQAKKRKWFLFLLAFVLIVASFYTYQSQKIFGPLFVLILLLIFRKQLATAKKELIIAGLVGLIFLIPILRVSLTPEGMIRLQAANIFQESTETQELALSRTVRNYQTGSLLGLIFDNRWTATAITFIRGYFSHFNPSWLFFSGEKDSHRIPGLGILYLWELPLILLGSYQLAKGNFSRETKWLLFSWFLLGPLPASIATQAPHGMRSFNLLPAPQILAAIGLVFIFSKLKSFRVLIWGGVIFLFFNLAYLYHNYFVNFPYEQSDSFQYPLAKAINYVLEVEDQYQRIIFSNQKDCHQSYMFFLFFKRYPPHLYLTQGGTVSGGFAESHLFGKYEFRPINWNEEERKGDILFIGNLDDFPREASSLKVFYFLDGEEALKAVAL